MYIAYSHVSLCLLLCLTACKSEAPPAGVGGAPVAAVAPPAPVAKAAAATVEDCAKKMASLNAMRDESAIKLFTSLCTELTPEQRGCVVAASDMATGKLCIPNKPLR